MRLDQLKAMLPNDGDDTEVDHSADDGEDNVVPGFERRTFFDKAVHDAEEALGEYKRDYHDFHHQPRQFKNIKDKYLHIAKLLERSSARYPAEPNYGPSLRAILGALDDTETLCMLLEVPGSDKLTLALGSAVKDALRDAGYTCDKLHTRGPRDPHGVKKKFKTRFYDTSQSRLVPAPRA